MVKFKIICLQPASSSPQFTRCSLQECLSSPSVSCRSTIMAPHKRLRIRPRVRTAVGVRHHPSGRGRSHGYSTVSRQLMLSTDDHINNGHYQGRHLVLHLRAIREWAHRTTVWRWRQRRATLGHIRRFRRTGNVRATVLKGRLLESSSLACVLAAGDSS